LEALSILFLKNDFFIGGSQMGIFIYLNISKSVTKPEWEAVYEETLQLIKNFPFAEQGRYSWSRYFSPLPA
jgi:hypothetical protein